MKITKLIIFSLVVLSGKAFAQQPASGNTENNFSLQQCIEYAIANHSSIKNAKIDELIAAAKVGEIRSSGLPQAKLDGLLLKNIKVQSMFAPASALDKSAPSNIIVPLAFGVDYSSSATLAIQQLIFNGEYLVGLQAAKTYMELATASTEASRSTLIQNITKGYYLNLVNEERKQIFTANLSRLDSLLKQTKILQATGLIEKIEVSRLEVAYNNLLTEKQKVDNLTQLGILSLKFQMGMPLSDNLKLTDKLNAYKVAAVENSSQVNFSNIPDYKKLMVQKRLLELELKSHKAKYLPTLAAFGNVGYNNGELTVSKLYSGKWYPYSNIGLSLSVPVFDGFQKYYKIQQSKLTLEKFNTIVFDAEQGLSLQAKSAEINLKNSLEALNNQQNNMKLAEEVAQVSEIKYKQGVGSNLEIVNAEASLKEAQINYYNALYDVLVYKVDMDFALGNLK
jgi:outer membrane protein TolC